MRSNRKPRRALPKRSLVRAYELLEANEYPALKPHGNSNGGRVYTFGGMTGTDIGRAFRIDDAAGRYSVFAKGALAEEAKEASE